MKTKTKESKKNTSVKSKDIAIPKGWYKAGSAPSEYEMGITDSEFHSGTQCAQIHSKVKSTDEFGTLMQSIGTEKFKGKRVRLSSYIKSKAVKGWSGLWMRIDAGKKMVGFDNMRYRAIKGDTDWTKYEVVLDVPQSSTNISFGVLLAGTGKVWFDDCNFEIVDKTVKLTDLSRSCGIRYQNDSPVNLDFSKGTYTKTTDSCLKSVPIGWFKQVRPRNGNPYTVNVKDNSVSIKSKKESKDTNISIALLQAISADEFVGKRIKLSGEVKTKIEKGNSGLWVRADAGYDLNVCHDYMDDRKIKGDTEWKKYNCIIDVPRESDNIYIGGTFKGFGTVKFRNFKIEVVSSNVPTTGNFGTLKKCKEAKSKPVNLNFEEA